ncbi:MAG: radical SAM protein [Desulfomonilia bacterium]|jgi:anaerobic magnesium-protoporphyrin IX monomethyl ester cyclase
MRTYCLLISSPRFARHFPRGIVEIAGFLNANGCATEVLPLAHYIGAVNPGEGFTPEYEALIEGILRETLASSRPAVVGISNTFTTDYPLCLKILEICKRIDGNLVTVMGGPHVTFSDADCLSSPAVDVVVRGEGEWTMLDLLSCLKKGADLSSVAGISHKQGGLIVRNPDRELGDIGSIPPIDFGLLPADFVREAQVFGISTRGCAYRCRYCVESVFWRKKRNYPVKRVVDEMEILDRRYGNKVLGFFESMFDPDSTLLYQLCDEIAGRGLGLCDGFNFHMRPDSVNRDRIEAIHRTGMSRAILGVESVSPKVLKMMNRSNMGRERIIDACRIIREKGISVHTYWIVGHPGDTPEEADDSFNFLVYLLENDLCQTAEAMIFQPYPGTCFYTEPEKYGVEILETGWDRWNRFDSYPVSQLKDFSAEDIHKAWKRFDSYLHTWRRLSKLGGLTA